MVYWVLKASAPSVVTLTVPVPVNVPVPPLTIVPATGEKVALAPMVKVPPTPKLLLPVTVAEAAMVKSENNRLLLELEMAEPLFIVTVPADGWKVPPLLYKVPAIVNPFAVVTVPVMV